MDTTILRETCGTRRHQPNQEMVGGVDFQAEGQVATIAQQRHLKNIGKIYQGDGVPPLSRTSSGRRWMLWDGWITCPSKAPSATKTFQTISWFLPPRTRSEPWAGTIRRTGIWTRCCSRRASGRDCRWTAGTQAIRFRTAPLTHRSSGISVPIVCH